VLWYRLRMRAEGRADIASEITAAAEGQAV